MFVAPPHAAWFGRRKEREVLKVSGDHLNLVLGVIRKTRGVFEAFAEGDSEKANKLFEEVFRLEREADAKKEEIIAKLSRGLFHPIDREEIVRWLFTVDDLADFAKAAARKILLAKREDIPPDVIEGMMTVVRGACEAAEGLADVLNALVSEPAKTIGFAEKVERMEEKVDETRIELIEKVVAWGNAGCRLGSWLAVKDAIEDMEEVADRAENAADVARVMALLTV